MSGSFNGDTQTQQALVQRATDKLTGRASDYERWVWAYGPVEIGDPICLTVSGYYRKAVLGDAPIAHVKGVRREIDGSISAVLARTVGRWDDAPWLLYQNPE